MSISWQDGILKKLMSIRRNAIPQYRGKRTFTYGNADQVLGESYDSRGHRTQTSV
jgi:hypothetical protein